MTIATRVTIVYTPTAADLVRIYLEMCEIVFCFMIAIVRELTVLTVRTVKFIQAWPTWRFTTRFGPIELGFNLQQDWDDLEVIWYSWDVKGKGFILYWCREDGWVKVSW
jgi:hypothetical protein